MNMNNNFNTGARIHELRIQQGLSQEQLALRAEITTTYLGLIERNLKNPTIKIIEQLCNSLNISLSDFFNTSIAPSNTADATSAQIAAQLGGLTQKEKDLVLQIVKNAVKLCTLTDKL